MGYYTGSRMRRVFFRMWVRLGLRPNQLLTRVVTRVSSPPSPSTPRRSSGPGSNRLSRSSPALCSDHHKSLIVRRYVIIGIVSAEVISPDREQHPRLSCLETRQSSLCAAAGRTNSRDRDAASRAEHRDVFMARLCEELRSPRVVYLPPVLPGSLPSSGFRCSWK